MLLIPLTLAASRGDQIINANSFLKNGYAHVLVEEDLTEETFIKAILKLKEAGPVLIDKMKNYESEKARDRVIEIIKEQANK